MNPFGLDIKGSHWFSRKTNTSRVLCLSLMKLLHVKLWASCFLPCQMRSFIVLTLSYPREVQWMLLFAKTQNTLTHPPPMFITSVYILCLAYTKHWPRFWNIKINGIQFDSQSTKKPCVDNLLHSQISYLWGNPSIWQWSANQQCAIVDCFSQKGVH